MLLTIIAVITIGFGVNLPNAMVHESAKYVVAAYSGAYVLVHVILEIYNRRKRKGNYLLPALLYQLTVWCSFHVIMGHVTKLLTV